MGEEGGPRASSPRPPSLFPPLFSYRALGRRLGLRPRALRVARRAFRVRFRSRRRRARRRRVGRGKRDGFAGRREVGLQRLGLGQRVVRRRARARQVGDEGFSLLARDRSRRVERRAVPRGRRLERGARALATSISAGGGQGGGEVGGEVGGG